VLTIVRVSVRWPAQTVPAAPLQLTPMAARPAEDTAIRFETPMRAGTEVMTADGATAPGGAVAPVAGGGVGPGQSSTSRNPSTAGGTWTTGLCT
jgi:hypothetical protein